MRLVNQNFSNQVAKNFAKLLFNLPVTDSRSGSPLGREVAQRENILRVFSGDFNTRAL